MRINCFSEFAKPWIRILCSILWMNLLACASTQSFLGINQASNSNPISNPFFDYQPSAKSLQANNLILRTKKGDRSVELEIPGDAAHLSEFVLPMSPAFKNSLSTPQGEEGRSIASMGSAVVESDSGASLGGEGSSPDSAKKPINHAPTYSDREITESFPELVPQQNERRMEIERDLHLSQTSDTQLPKTSYLARMDSIKQLYKQRRFEAALMETDELVKLYPTDAKLHEMRGTLLDHMGRRELAIRSWNQALRLNPNNVALRKFVERKQVSVPAPISTVSLPSLSDTPPPSVTSGSTTAEVTSWETPPIPPAGGNL